MAADSATTSLLRFITCGSVDDGKSTLIGRLLYESKLLYEDTLAELQRDSVKLGTRGGEIDYALLLDGLAAEREQGITIDVAYRFFSTERRKYIVADTPGHEQYTRNMATGASNADLAVLLVDARKGVLKQTRRHAVIVSLLGIRHVVVAVNKMDLVDWDEATFRSIEREIREFVQQLQVEQLECIPMSAVAGDNIIERGDHMPWYGGPSLMQLLESVEIDEARSQRGPLRLPVQWVARPNQDFRGFAGQLASGVLRSGQRVRVLPSGRESHVVRIVGPGGDQPDAVAGESVIVTLADEVDASRGTLICAADAPAPVSDEFEATLVWMDEEPMLRGRSYLMKIGPTLATTSVMPLKYKLDVGTLDRLAAETLQLNEIGVCELQLDRQIAFDPYRECRETGGFILIDRLSHRTVAAGMLHFALRRAQNVHWQALDVGRVQRAAAKGQKPAVVWLTGLSGAGKSTIANGLEKRLHAAGRHTYLLDGDNVRHGLNKDLGFTEADRVENIRRVGEVAKLMADAGLIVIVAFISPFRAERNAVRAILPEGEFIEVHVHADLPVAEARDPKGLYGKARRGELKNFTGIDSPYEAPESPELRIDTAACTPEDAVEQVFEALEARGRLTA